MNRGFTYTIFLFVVADDIIFGIDGDKISDQLETLSTLTPIKQTSKKRDRRVIILFNEICKILSLIDSQILSPREPKYRVFQVLIVLKINNGEI